MPDDFSLEKLGEVWKHGVSPESLSQLPQGICPRSNIASSDIMQILISANSEGSYTVMKVVHFQDTITLKDAANIASGTVAFIPYRKNTFGVRKAFQQMLQQTRGWRMLFAEVVSQTGGDDDGGRASKRQEWSPSSAEIAAGINYIKNNAPPSGGLEQVEWMLINVKASDSLIRGWPLGYVQKCCDVKAKITSGAAVEQNFPLTVFDSKSVFVNDILRQARRVALFVFDRFM